MILSAIAAMASNRVIGRDNQLPWNIPADMKFFMEKTKGHCLIMGRKTFESLPNGKPLPKRLSVVVTRKEDYQPEGVAVCQSIDEAIEFCKSKIGEWPEEVFICGGGEIYKQTIDRVDRIYLTEIEKPYEGDAKFPEFDRNKFELTWCEEHNEPEPFKFQLFERK